MKTREARLCYTSSRYFNVRYREDYVQQSNTLLRPSQRKCHRYKCNTVT